MRGSRIVALLMTVSAAAGVFAACAPLLSFDNLGDPPPSEADAAEDVTGTDDSSPAAGDARMTDGESSDAGSDALVADAGDLCRFAEESDAETYYCEPALLGTSTNAARLWKCLDGARAAPVTDCPFGCYRAPSKRPDFCIRCNDGNGDFCPSQFASVYSTYPPLDDFVVHCGGFQPDAAYLECTPGTRCVVAGSASHCP